MRKTSSFKIEGYDRNFVVNELTIRQIIDLMQDERLSEDKITLNDFKEYFGNTVLPSFSNITFDDLIEMAPSELKTIWEKFQEVNSVFFEVARSLGLEKILEDLRRAIIEDSLNLLAPSLKRGMSSS